MNDRSWVIAGVLALAAYWVARRFLGGSRAPSNVVMEKIKSGAQVLDVRSPNEFRGGAYPGAVNVPVNDLGRRLNEFPKDKPVVLYCAAGARSAMAARLMKQAGFTDVTNAGGLADMPR
ncbi:MAG TPA: rhodanese-like domain-containing protein [Anaeromyxobacteraceae bacterium]|nr:rhodanese-like domain-containing protein [Anaeromyxobacteraceae bacterium]